MDHEWTGTNRRNLRYLVKVEEFWDGGRVMAGLKHSRELVEAYHKTKGLGLVE